MSTQQEKILKPKLGFLELAKQLGNVSQPARSWATVGTPSTVKRNSTRTVARRPLKIAVEYPAYGQLRAANELRKEGIIISPGGVRSVWLR